MKNFCFIFILLFFSCKKNKNKFFSLKKKQLEETQISIDQDFGLVIEEQLKVFHSQNKKLKIIPNYKTQNEALKDLLKENTSMVVLARDLSKKEKEVFYSNFSYYPSSIKLASEPILVLTHFHQEKKFFSSIELKEILENPKSGFEVFIEGNSSDFIINELINFTKAKKLSSTIKKVKKKKDFFTFISLKKNKIGFISLTSFLDFQKQNNDIKKIKIVALKNKEDKIIKPFQENFIDKNYPLIKPIFSILKENYFGAGKKFDLFLIKEKGQLIFSKLGFFPSQMNFRIRKAQINKN